MKHNWSLRLIALLIALLMAGTGALAEAVEAEADAAAPAAADEVVEATVEAGFDAVAAEEADMLGPVEAPQPETPAATSPVPPADAPEIAPKAVTLAITPTNVKLPVKGTLRLYVKTNYAGAVKFTSKNKRVAKVSSEGVITAVKRGTTTITVKAGKVSKTCRVTVKNISGKDLSKYVGYGLTAASGKLGMGYGDEADGEWNSAFGRMGEQFMSYKGTLMFFSSDYSMSLKSARVRTARISGSSSYNICGLTTKMSASTITSKLKKAGWKLVEKVFTPSGDTDIEEEDDDGGCWTYDFRKKSNNNLRIMLMYNTDGFRIIQYSNLAIR